MAKRWSWQSHYEHNSQGNVRAMINKTQHMQYARNYKMLDLVHCIQVFETATFAGVLLEI